MDICECRPPDWRSEHRNVFSSSLRSAWLSSLSFRARILFLSRVSTALISLLFEWLRLWQHEGRVFRTRNAARLASLNFIGLLCGWILVIIISYVIATGEKFRQWTDISLILITAGNCIFRVSDKNVTVGKKYMRKQLRISIMQPNILLGRLKTTAIYMPITSFSKY